MSKIINLLDSLDSKVVVFFDDKCTSVATPHQSVVNLLKLPDTQQNFILESIFSAQKEPFLKLKDWIRTLEKPNLFLSLLQRNEYETYINTHGDQEFISTIRDLVALSNIHEIKKKLELYGVNRRLPKPFDPFFDEMILGKLYLIYNQIAHNDDVLNDLEPLKENVNSNFTLFILDNADEDNNNAGYDFIASHLDKARVNDEFKYISILLTSKPKDDPIQKPVDYFRREVEKNSADMLTKVESNLILAAYSYFILELERLYQQGITQARDFSLKNYKNFSNVLASGHEEGIAPFESMTDWLNIIIDYHIQKNAIGDYISIFGLTSFFEKNLSDDLPSAEPDFDSIKDMYQDILSNEIFDYYVNQKHLPPAPGDVFKDINTNSYKVLLGQACDMSMRYDEKEEPGGEEFGKACRKIKIAQLLPAIFTPSKHEKDKFTRQKESIILRDFKQADGSVGNLTIKLNEQQASDFDVIDSAMFNSTGECTIPLSRALPNEIVKILPLGKNEIYKVLQKKAQEKVNIINTINAADGMYDNFKKLINQHTDYSTFVFEINEKDEQISYPLQRVARIKKAFFSPIYKSYIDYQGRIDLNMLNTVHQNIKSIPVTLKVASQPYKHIDYNLNVYTQDDGVYLKLDEINEYFEGFDISTLFSFDPHIKLDAKNTAACVTSKTKFTVKDKEIIIEIPVLLHDHSTHLNHEIPLKKAIGESINLEEISFYQIEGDATEHAITERSKLTIFEDIQKGVLFPEVKKKMIVNKGKIEITEI